MQDVDKLSSSVNHRWQTLQATWPSRTCAIQRKLALVVPQKKRKLFHTDGPPSIEKRPKRSRAGVQHFMNNPFMIEVFVDGTPVMMQKPVSESDDIVVAADETSLFAITNYILARGPSFDDLFSKRLYRQSGTKHMRTVSVHGKQCVYNGQLAASRLLDSRSGNGRRKIVKELVDHCPTTDDDDDDGIEQLTMIFVKARVRFQGIVSRPP